IDFADFPLRRDAALPSWNDANKADRREWLRTGVVPHDYPGPVAADWPDLLEIIERRVRPERKRQKDRRAADIWWQFQRRRPGLYGAIAPLKRIIATSQISAHHCFCMLRTGTVFANRLTLFACDSMRMFALLQSSTHYLWARSFG